MSAVGPVRATVAVGGIAFDGEGRLLVIRRGRPPEEGRYTIPGGKVEPGENLTAACRREVEEETGLLVEVGPVVEVVEKIGRTDDGRLAFHFVIVDFLCALVGGELAVAGDAAEAFFASRAELDALPTTEALLPVIDRAWAQLLAARRA